MARSTFGGGASDFVFTSTTGGLLRLASASLTFWDAEFGGTQHTDLLIGADPVDTITVGTDGQVPSFEGPDGVTTMWADTGTGAGRAQLAASGDLAAAAAASAAEAATSAASVNPGVANGIATLDAAAKLPEVQVPDRLSASGLSATFGATAPPPNGTDDTAAIQALLDAAETAGGGSVRLRPAPPSAPYKVSSLTIASGVKLYGAGVRATRVQQLAGSNTDMIRSKNFATLFGTNKWLVSEGVAYGFELHSLTLDGNRANNTSGRGVAFYGKGFVVRNVKTINTAGEGFYSEAGTGSGQTDSDDMPEASVTVLWVHKAGGVGVRWRGPHDGFLDQVYVSQPDDEGARFEQATSIYQGAADIGFLHVYASQTAAGVLATAQIHAQHIITESNYAGGMEFAAGSGGSRVGMLSLFKNKMQYLSKAPFAPQADPHLLIAAGVADVQIAQLRIEAEYGGTAVSVEGNQAKITEGMVVGSASDGRGLAIAGNGFSGRVDVRGFSATGGVGVKEATGAAGVTGSDYSAHISDCATCLTFGFQGVRNRRSFFINTLTGQVAHDGSAFAGTNNRTEILCSGVGTGGIDRFDVPGEFHRKGVKVLTDNGLTIPQFFTAGRPSAATAGVGTAVYDKTLSKPVWSDGTVWRDAAGTAV